MMASVAAKINFRISLTNHPVLIVIYTLSDSKPHRFDNDFAPFDTECRNVLRPGRQRFERVI
jgi:hypothetical protein